MLEKLVVIAMIVFTLIFAGLLIAFRPQPSTIPTVEIIYVTPQATPEPNVWIKCYSGGEVIFEGSAIETFSNKPFDFSFGAVRWNDMDGSRHIFTNGEACHIYQD